MKTSCGQGVWNWHLNLLPSIEYTNLKEAGLGRRYGHDHEVEFRWLHYWLCLGIGANK